METDKKVIRFFSLFCILSLALAFLSYAFKCRNSWLEFLSYLFLGLFGSGVVVIFVSVISAKNRFKKSMNKMLFYAKVAKISYDEFLYIDKGRFIKYSQKFIECHNNFYNCYTTIEYVYFNRKFEKYIKNLFTTFTAFVAPFASAVSKNEIRDITAKDLDFYFAEARTLTRIKFYEFVHSYVDLYSLWDRKMLDFDIDVDETAKESYSTRDVGIKHETIKQILAKH
jgi:hypothetical protein